MPSLRLDPTGAGGPLGLTCEIDGSTGQWSLRSVLGAALEQVRFGARLRARGRALEWQGHFSSLEVTGGQGQLTTSGRLRLESIELGWRADFALDPGRAGLRWRVEVSNPGPEALELERIDLAVPGQVRLPGGQPAFFSNGYQSWSYAGALRAAGRQPPSLFGPLGDPKRLNLLTPRVRERGHFTSEMFAVLGQLDSGLGLVLGFLGQREQFGHVEARLRPDGTAVQLSAQCDGVVLEPGQARRTDWAWAQFVRLEDPDPLADYLAAAAQDNVARVPAHTPVGWCSWYHYFDQVTEADVLGNLEALRAQRAGLPLEFVQLDDGFQAQVGDWFETKPTFPHGLPWLTERVRAQGQTPGLWLAPYIVRSDARLFHDHPDWFIQDSHRSRPASAGYNWFRWCHGLDPTHPAVREHTRRLIETAVREWGFPYLKLDFLYAAALPGRRHDPRLTRAQAMRLALSDIRAAAGDSVFLLGCGCPLGSAIGLVDGMRISTDVAPDWAPQLFTPLLAPALKPEMEFVAARNAIRNTLTRAPLHRRWWLNDPDCLLVRDRDTRLSETEVRSLATVIGLSGGMFLLSDDLSKLNPERLRYVRPLLPVLEAGAQARGWMERPMPELFVLSLERPHGAWRVAGVFNWDDRRRDREVTLSELGLDPAAAHLVSDFWEGRQWVHPAGEPLRFPDVPAHGAHLLAVRSLETGPQLAATSFHFSQGGEIPAWEAGAGQLRFRIELGRVDQGEVRLRLPAEPRRALAGGQPVPVLPLSGGLYALRLKAEGSAEVEVSW